jgi:hypothetical protein
MLKEFPRVRQEPGSYRRLFCDDRHDLYVWYDETCTHIAGFQIIYFEGDAQKVYTWREGNGSDHMGVDDWDSNRFNRTPLLVTDGKPNYDALFYDMQKELTAVDADIRNLVLDALGSENRAPSMSF